MVEEQTRTRESEEFLEDLAEELSVPLIPRLPAYDLGSLPDAVTI